MNALIVIAIISISGFWLYFTPVCVRNRRIATEKRWNREAMVQVDNHGIWTYRVRRVFWFNYVVTIYKHDVIILMKSFYTHKDASSFAIHWINVMSK